MDCSRGSISHVELFLHKQSSSGRLPERNGRWTILLFDESKIARSITALSDRIVRPRMQTQLLHIHRHAQRLRCFDQQSSDALPENPTSHHNEMHSDVTDRRYFASTAMLEIYAALSGGWPWWNSGRVSGLRLRCVNPTIRCNRSGPSSVRSDPEPDAIRGSLLKTGIHTIRGELCNEHHGSGWRKEGPQAEVSVGQTVIHCHLRAENTNDVLGIAACDRFRCWEKGTCQDCSGVVDVVYCQLPDAAPR